ncbi:MAG: AMP-binding protein [Acidobacteriota bacterium]|nr:AMP-binding protein [Acidobacteriota bacterium]
MPDQIFLPQFVSRNAVTSPDAIALQHVDGRSMTWQELDATSQSWATALERQGVRFGEPVVTIFPMGFEAAQSWIGAAALGAIEAPINSSYKGTWLKHPIDLTGARHMLIDARFLDAVAEIADTISGVELLVVFGADGRDLPSLPFRVITGEEFLHGAEPTERESRKRWEIASLIFTSGTTGPSKAVMVPYGHLESLMNADIGYERGAETQYAPFPPYHITGKGPIYSSAEYCGRVVMREVFSTKAYWQDVREHGCTGAVILGPMAQFLLSQPEKDDDAQNPLEHVLMAPVIPEIDRFCERFGVAVHTVFNMTEINSPVTSSSRSVDGETYRSCGRPRPGVEVRIVDEHDIEVPPDTPGEMMVRAEPWALNAGYWGMPEKTAEAWRNGWFHTGDTFTRDEDGNLYFVDRAKDYIRRRGENISSFEVETTVNGHPDVLEAAAVAVPSPEGEDEVKVAVVMIEGKLLDPESIIEYLIPRMPRFAIPRYIEEIAELPKTQATQRIQKAEIRATGIGEHTWDRIAAGVELPR